MPVEVAMNTPLADALQNEIQPKLVEYGWAPSDASDATMAEYLILMIVNGKTEEDIASELSSELLNLGPEDNSAREFSKWLFETIEAQNAKFNAPSKPPASASENDGDHDMEMDLSSAADNVGDISAPTGPRAMRNGPGFRGGREKRVMGQINRAMDRSNDAVLHRIRGQGGGADRINTHARGSALQGPRMGGVGGFGAGRQHHQPPQRNMNGRAAAGFNHALAAAGMAGGPPPGGMPWMGPTGSPQMQPGPMDVYAMLEQQSRMMQQMQEQMQQQQQQLMTNRRGGFNAHSRGRPLADRIQHPHQTHKNFRNGQHNQEQHGVNGGGDAQSRNGSRAGDAAASTGDDNDVDMGAGTAHREAAAAAADPSETMCKFNLSCANKDCKFAHQSPAAPPGITVDVHDVCTYGAACKNKKCVARHPSPATRVAHQSEQDCKFYPNCTNPHCVFRHPAMPPCRNGGDCAVPNCKFAHSKTMCKFHPCTNRYCTFKHEEGQRGIFPDKVWTADGGSSSNGSRPHISERKFVDESAPEETILPDADHQDTAGEGAEIS
ncbi:hypothetical protein SPI_08617 [Niveomyces insectorum RCEF 264]|uniref:Nab2-like CCCH zinc finger domain-containing protein n=1 Tax=Niveomyces insectorum RCEF 264 TaxID=1081102 RepID=A0A167MTS8_9HYPO|nr:hypothetical protein SPI_08617 [Niveomyces insectorum RCEF 264]